MSGLFDGFLDNLGTESDKLKLELEVLKQSLREKESAEEAMQSLVNTGKNEMQTKSPIYTDADVARHLNEEGNEVEEYIYNRIKQVFGGS